eukprot:179287-Chlamydomonas_euryale.AAC.2
MGFSGDGNGALASELGWRWLAACGVRADPFAATLCPAAHPGKRSCNRQAGHASTLVCSGACQAMWGNGVWRVTAKKASVALRRQRAQFDNIFGKLLGPANHFPNTSNRSVGPPGVWC